MQKKNMYVVANNIQLQLFICRDILLERIYNPITAMGFSAMFTLAETIV